MWEPLTTTQDTWDQSPVREMTGHGLLVHYFPGPQWSCLVTFFFLPWVTLPSVHISEHSGTYVWPVIQNAHPRMDHGVSLWNTSLSQCSHGYSLPNQPPSHGEGWSLQPSSFTWGPQSLMTPLWGSASIFLLYHGSQKIIQGWNTTPVFCIWPHYPCSHRHPLYHDRLIHSFMSLVAQTVKTLVTESFLPASFFLLLIEGFIYFWFGERHLLGNNVNCLSATVPTSISIYYLSGIQRRLMKRLGILPVQANMCC